MEALSIEKQKKDEIKAALKQQDKKIQDLIRQQKEASQREVDEKLAQQQEQVRKMAPEYTQTGASLSNKIPRIKSVQAGNAQHLRSVAVEQEQIKADVMKQRQLAIMQIETQAQMLNRIIQHIADHQSRMMRLENNQTALQENQNALQIRQSQIEQYQGEIANDIASGEQSTLALHDATQLGSAKITENITDSIGQSSGRLEKAHSWLESKQHTHCVTLKEDQHQNADAAQTTYGGPQAQLEVPMPSNHNTLDISQNSPDTNAAC